MSVMCPNCAKRVPQADYDAVVARLTEADLVTASWKREAE